VRLKRFKENLSQFGSRISNKKLLVFDYRSVLLFMICIVTFFVLVAFKINYSSIKCWDDVFSKDPNNAAHREIIFGTSKSIRSDEYDVITPAMLSQAKQDPRFPAENKTIGVGKAPLLMSLPVNDVSTIFRPQNLGFFVFDFETAFSFYWNFKVFSLFLGMFLLLMLLTRNNFWLSIFGSLWVFFSAFIQWWFSTPAMLPEMIASFAILIVSAAYIFFAKTKRGIALAGIVWLISSINFILFFYPPFQIPLIYLAIFLFAAFAIRNFSADDIKNRLAFRILCVAAIAAIFCFVALHVYHEIKDTVTLVRSTVYPGIRSTNGGTMDPIVFFSGFYGILFTEKYFPPGMINVCEASNFLLFFPILLLFVVFDFWKKRKINPLFVGLLAYFVLMGSWFFVGFLPDLAKISLFSTVPPGRAIIGTGLASIIWVIIFFSEKKQETSRKIAKKPLIISLVFVIFVLLFVLLGYSLNLKYGFFTIPQTIFVSVIFAAMCALLVYKNKYFFLLLLPVLIIPNFPVNPIAHGISSIEENDLMKFAEEINHKQKNSTWIVYKSAAYANFLKASGVNVMNGVHYSPDLQTNKLLDPRGDYTQIYNRYAHIDFENADNADEINFRLDSVDAYTVYANPCSDRVKSLGIDYVVLPQKFLSSDFPCLKTINKKPIDGLNIYRYQN